MSDSSDHLGSGDIHYPCRVGNLYNAVTLTSANGTTPVTIITGAPGYYITDMGIQIDPVSTIAAAATVMLSFTDTSSGGVFSLLWYIPSVLTGPGAPTNLRQATGPGTLIWSSKVATSKLQVSVSTALLTGSARFFVRYGLTSILG